jgi:hypothetical protein
MSWVTQSGLDGECMLTSVQSGSESQDSKSSTVRRASVRVDQAGVSELWSAVE